MVAVESRSPNLVGERLCSYDDRQIDLNNAKISIFGNCSGFYSELAKPIAMKSLDRKVEDVFTLKASRDRQREMLKANLNNFTPSDRVISLDWRMPPKIAPRE
jgi:photosystem II PsbU protein